jgi:hypothetical protein
MINRYKRSKLAWLALLTAALALPGLAMGHGDRGWGDRYKSERYERSRYDQYDRHHHHHRKKHRAHHGRRDVLVIERPAYRRHYVPVAPRGPIGLDNEVNVFLRRSW